MLLKFPQGHRNQLLSCQPSSRISVPPESSSGRYSQTGFTALLGAIAVKTLLFEGFFPVLQALIISFPVHHSTVIVSLGLFLAAKKIIILLLDKRPQKSFSDDSVILKIQSELLFNMKPVKCS